MGGRTRGSLGASAVEPAIGASIIIACYNAADTLGETLDSLAVQQWHRPWEILLADNGSTDGSRALVADFARRHPEIALKIIDASERRGKPHALNAALRAARGRYILFCDADDTVSPGYLAAMGAALDDSPFVAARLDTFRLNPPWARAERRHPQTEGLSMLEHAPFCLHAGGATLGFRRELFDLVGEFDPAFLVLEDTDYCVRAHLKGYELRFVPDAVYNYRFRSTSASIYRQARAYAHFGALLRRRYANDGRSFFAPLPWLRLINELVRLSLARLGRRVLRRPQSPLGRARSSRRIGRAIGDLTGALAFRVAPPDLPGPSHAPTWRKLLERALRPAFGSLVAVRTSERVMALTFDDGPDPVTTPALLDVLAAHGIKATFFLIGARAVQHPGLVARIIAEGHEIGNHTWNHRALSTLRPRALIGQIRRARAALAPHGRALLRPPYGAQNLWTHLVIRLHGYRVVTWSINSADWRADDAATIAERVMAAASPGAIVLMHDTLYSFEDERYLDRTPTIESVGILARDLPSYHFVTVSELLRHGSAAHRVALTAPPAGYLAALKVAGTP